MSHKDKKNPDDQKFHLRCIDYTYFCFFELDFYVIIVKKYLEFLFIIKKFKKKIFIEVSYRRFIEIVIKSRDFILILLYYSVLSWRRWYFRRSRWSLFVRALQRRYCSTQEVPSWNSFP